MTLSNIEHIHTCMPDISTVSKSYKWLVMHIGMENSASCYKSDIYMLKMLIKIPLLYFGLFASIKAHVVFA